MKFIEVWAERDSLKRLGDIDCDPPGIASNDLSTFTYKKKAGKVYPLDKDEVYSESGA